MNHIYDMIVLGGGPAGYTAALYGARAGLEVLVLEQLGPGGQMALTHVIDNYPGFPEGIDGFELGMRMQQQAERFGAKTEFVEVRSLELQAQPKRVQTSAGEFFGKTVVIAAGAGPKPLGVAMEQELTGRGVHYCAECDGMFYKNKTVVVVGGGNSAAADALSLARVAKRVILIHRRDSLRATQIYHKPLMEAENIEIRWNSAVSELLHEGRLTGVKLRDTVTGEVSSLFCDGLFVSIGRKPATNLVEGQLDLDGAGYIVADESTRTTLPGVYAAGDVRVKPLRQIVTAVSDGAVAAHLAGEYLSAEA